MYLSRVEIDTNNRRKIQDLNHLGAYHNWVESSFPDEINFNKRTRKLWRIDSINGKSYLLIVSEALPNLTLLERYGVSGSAESKDYSKYLDKVKQGNKYRFKATLNPVRSVSDGTGNRGRVYPEITVEQQLKYLETRTEKHGFRLVENMYSITERKFETLKKPHKKPIRLSKVTYEGILVVTDSEQFKEVLVHGLGKEKAYGCGMITIIPV